MGAFDDARNRDERRRQRLDALIPDLLRRTFYSGLGALMTSEEGIRRVATEFSLPKDAVSYLLSQAQSTKNELFSVMSTEVSGFLKGLDVAKEARRVLAGMKLQIKTEISFIPDDKRADAADAGAKGDAD